MSAGLMLGSAIGSLSDCGEQPPSGFQQCGEVMRLWVDTRRRTVYGALEPLFGGTGGITSPFVEEIAPNLGLVPGDLLLSGTEQELSIAWPTSQGQGISARRAFGVTTAFWTLAQGAAAQAEADRSVLQQPTGRPPRADDDEYCLGLIKHYHSLAPLAQEARKPLFMLRSADGAIGAHQQSVRDAYSHFEALARHLINVLGIPGYPPGP